MSFLHGTSAPGSPGAFVPLDTAAVVDELFTHARSDHARFGTGYSLDDICGEVGVGEMALMWARSGSGKSTWYLNVINNTQEVPTLVVNMEMTPRRQMEWLTAMASNLQTPGRDLELVIRNGPDDARFAEVAGALEQMQYRFPTTHFVSPSRPLVQDLSIMLDDVEGSTGIRPVRVFIDHLGLMGGTEDGYQGYSKVTSNLHSWAMQESVALFVLQQTGRSGGDAGKNDGHLPVTFSSGVYTGEQDADWVLGLYRPDRNPRFKRDEHSFKDRTEWFDMRDAYAAVKGQTVLQVIKNRPFGEVCEDGVVLIYNHHSRRLVEIGQ